MKNESRQPKPCLFHHETSHFSVLRIVLTCLRLSSAKAQNAGAKWYSEPKRTSNIWITATNQPESTVSLAAKRVDKHLNIDSDMFIFMRNQGPGSQDLSNFWCSRARYKSTLDAINGTASWQSDVEKWLSKKTRGCQGTGGPEYFFLYMSCLDLIQLHPLYIYLSTTPV